MPESESPPRTGSAFTSALAPYDRRLRTTEAVARAIRWLAVGALSTLALLSLLWWSGRSTPFPLWALSPLLLAAVPVLQRLWGSPRPRHTVRRLDRQHGYDDLLKTALDIESEDTGRATSALPHLTVERAARRLDAETPEALVPYVWPREALALSALAPLLVALVVYSHRPEAAELLAAPGEARVAQADLATEDAAAPADEGDVPEPEPPPSAEPIMPAGQELEQVTGLGELGEQVEMPESLELSDAQDLGDATAQELEQALEEASETLGDELVQEESRRQEEAGMEPEGGADDAAAAPLAERRAAPQGEHEGRSPEASEGDEAGQDGQAPTEQTEVPSPFKPQLEKSQAEAQAGDQMTAMDVGGEAQQAQQAQGQPSEGDAAGSFGDSTAPQGEEVTPFGDATEMPVTLEIAILEAQKEEEKIEGDKREKASEAQESEVGFRSVRTPSEAVASVTVDRERISWLHRQLVHDYFLELENVLEAQAEKERLAAEARRGAAGRPTTAPSAEGDSQ